MLASQQLSQYSQRRVLHIDEKCPCAEARHPTPNDLMILVHKMRNYSQIELAGSCVLDSA
jgi:hypothetical protein